MLLLKKRDVLKPSFQRVRFQVSFWRTPTNAGIIEFSEVQVKNCVWLFFSFYFERNYDVLRSKDPYF